MSLSLSPLQTQPSDEDGSSGGRDREEGGEGNTGREMVIFGANVDLSDEEIWCKQLLELNKLPPFLRVSLISTAVYCHHFYTHLRIFLL